MKLRRRADRNAWMIDFRIKGRRYRQCLPGSLPRKDAEQQASLLVADAHAAFKREDHERLRAEIRADLLLDSDGALSTPEMWAASLVRKARSRARQRRMPFSLDADYILGLFEAQCGRCDLTGIPFDFDPHVSGYRRPFAPSIDRIDCREGYTPSNCRLICAAANIAMADWGEAVLRRIAIAMVAWCPSDMGTNDWKSGANSGIRTRDLQSHNAALPVECEENQRVVRLLQRKKGQDVA